MSALWFKSFVENSKTTWSGQTFLIGAEVLLIHGVHIFVSCVVFGLKCVFG